ncbi:hypothetical protein V6N11_017349 [Hibiscus sabdariffa]|uniref:NB-ARC domain-containing protein n=1 Tax=Hibiscus sabdariffa TaxID=183260 RepID=A0ABR2TY18_9ROSI
MQLCERLMKTYKRVLIVLDDLWQKLDLEEIGISFQEAAAQKSSTDGCKLLLTSRSSQVLDLMDAERSFRVEILSQEESTIPFAKIVGDIVGKSNDYERIANELVEKCAGLPVAISPIANVLKRRDLSSWKDALRRLRKVGPNKKEMQETVSSTIELSYNLLESELITRGKRLQMGENACKKNTGMWAINDENHLKELLKKRNLKGCTAISLPHSNIPELFDQYIPNAQIMPQDLFLRMLERYKIAIGPHGRDYSLLQSIDNNNFFTTIKASKSLELEIDIGNGLHKGMEMLVKKAEELHIVG